MSHSATPHASDPIPASSGGERIEPWALVLALLPLIGLAGGVISLFRGKPRNGLAMIAIGLASLVVLSLLR
jgi:hypothetical protein